MLMLTILSSTESMCTSNTEQTHRVLSGILVAEATVTAAEGSTVTVDMQLTH